MLWTNFFYRNFKVKFDPHILKVEWVAEKNKAHVVYLKKDIFTHE